MEYIYEYFLEIVECKFARNGLTNWKTFLTNILKNIIWHLFAGESLQVVKLTVPYCTALNYLHIQQAEQKGESKFWHDWWEKKWAKCSNYPCFSFDKNGNYKAILVNIS